ncbi:YceI family protein [Salegentibacter chungangensis]|uniref:YceI family protein n=1 Tax=Salegentibacter chungangensis TaxID=1335724 RepID=A0ABW3NM51_9FLAO
MSFSKKISLLATSFLMMVLTAQVSLAQTYKVNNSASDLKVEGTSNVHDWELDAEKMSGSLTAELNEGQLTEISKLDFTVVAESLNSGKGGMDKNTYKALKTNNYDKIIYTLAKVNNLDCTSASQCKINTSGYLTIAGTKKPVDITFNAKVNGDKIVLSGNKTLDMTDFNVEPPTAMFGAITTGKEVTIKFNTEFKK